jgi:hypothetical protein
MNTKEKQRGSPEVTYEELFGTPALGDTEEPEQRSPYEVGNPSGTPPDPPLLFTLSPPAKEACKRLWPVAWRYASDHMQVMIGVRRALKEAHEAAEEAGGLDL